jgi:hypothetical protein
MLTGHEEEHVAKAQVGLAWLPLEVRDDVRQCADGQQREHNAAH